MNRFDGKRNRKTNFVPTAAAGLVIVFLGGAIVLMSSMIGRDSAKEEKKALMAALDRDVAECYATYGFYPPGEAFLEEKFGLVYDKNKYRVFYEFIGDNIHPEYTVVERK